MQFKGVVKEVSSFDFNGKALWSFQLNGDRNYYRCGDKRPNVESGNYITFEGNQGAKNGSINVVKGTIQSKSVEAESSGVQLPKVNVTGSVSGKDDYWNRKEDRDVATQRRIEIQSCRNSSLEFIKILLSQEAVKFGAKADKVEILEQLLAKYTEQFISENSGTKKEEDKLVEPEMGSDEVPY